MRPQPPLFPPAPDTQPSPGGEPVPPAPHRSRRGVVAILVVTIIVVAVPVVGVVTRNGTKAPSQAQASRSSPPVSQSPAAQLPTPQTPPDFPIPIEFDEFSSPASGWPQNTGKNYGYEYIGGEYRIMERRPGRYRWASSGGGNTYEAVVAVVEAHGEPGQDGRFGIMCEANGDYRQGYVFLVGENDRTYSVQVLVDRDLTVLTEGVSDEIRTSDEIEIVGSANRLRAYCQPSESGARTQLTFRVNGVMVAQVEDDTFTRFSGGGMFVQCGTTPCQASFDDLVVTA